MPKPYTYPTLFDDALKINISKLKGWGYLKPNQITNNTLTWSRNGSPIATISISVNTKSEQPYIELDYKHNQKPKKYKVYLISKPSNLGKGLVWYFLCPETYKRCRNLYLIGGYFLHREAFKGCLYESQTRSKEWQMIDKVFGFYFIEDKLYEELYSKNFKKFYNGKPTKRYLKLMQKINHTKTITHTDIEQALMFGIKSFV